MKAVLISIKPKWCELIANGKKTIEVRKSKPKIETPFKCYIYCTKIKNTHIDMFLNYDATENKTHICNGKVIGEFVCDYITPLFNICTDNWDYLVGSSHDNEKELVSMANLTETELHRYAGGKNCYAWHISDLVIYDKPKELSEFGINRAFQSWGYVESEG